MVDGAVRDVDAVEALGVPLFARAVTPAGPFKVGPHLQQVPVALGGQCVVPGDVIIGDADGVVVIPFARLRDAVESAEEIQVTEELKRATTLERLLALEPPTG